MTQTETPAKPRPTYSPPCICTHEYDTSGRFPVWQITKFEPDCLAHGYMFRINLAADLRYGD